MIKQRGAVNPMNPVDDQDEGVRSLLKLASDRSVQGRKALVARIGALFSEKETSLSERERALMTEILNKLIHEFEMSVRRDLAERLAGKPNTPSELMMVLAKDEIEVARPILLKSKVLRDPQLLEIIHNRTREHQLAIAMRRSVSEIISDALVDTGHPDIIKALLENHGASISEATMEYLVDESRRLDEFQEPLVQRDELSPHLAQRMYGWVSAALRAHILENFDIDPTELDDELESVMIESIGKTSDAPADDRSPTPAEKLAKKLTDSQEITPDLLIKVLRQGEVALFEALFGQLSGLKPPRLQRVLYEPGGKDLVITCRALGMAKSTFSMIFLLSRRGQGNYEASDPRDVARLMTWFDHIKPEAASRVLHHWRRNPNYLEAIEQLEESRDGQD